MGDPSQAISTELRYHPAIVESVHKDEVTKDECVAMLPELPPAWRENFCEVAVTYHRGQFTFARFATDKRRDLLPAEQRILRKDQIRSPFRLELAGIALLRDTDGPCLADDPTMAQDMDDWWGTAPQRTRAWNEVNPSGPCSQWTSAHAGWDNLHLAVVDLTQQGPAIFPMRHELPHAVQGIVTSNDAAAFWQSLGGFWSFGAYPSTISSQDILRWDLTQKDDLTALSGAAWHRQYQEDKLLKGVINLGVLDLLSMEATNALGFSQSIADGKFNEILVQGPTISDNGKYEFGAFQTFGPQWVSYTSGYNVLGVQSGHEYAVVVFGSDGGRLLNRSKEVLALQADSDDIVAIRRITPDEIRDGAVITMYERPRVKIDKDGRERLFPSAGVVFLTIAANK